MNSFFFFQGWGVLFFLNINFVIEIFISVYNEFLNTLFFLRVIKEYIFNEKRFDLLNQLH